MWVSVGENAEEHLNSSTALERRVTAQPQQDEWTCAYKWVTVLPYRRPIGQNTHSKFEIVIFWLIDLVFFVWLFDLVIFKLSVL